jgi:hypothetical protein
MYILLQYIILVTNVGHLCLDCGDFVLTDVVGKNDLHVAVISEVQFSQV